MAEEKVIVRFESTVEDNNKTSFVKVGENDTFDENTTYYIYSDAAGYEQVEINEYEFNKNKANYFYVDSTFMMLSGPVEIFATVDDLSSTPTRADILNSKYFNDEGIFDIEKYSDPLQFPDNRVGLYSPYVTRLLKEEFGPEIDDGKSIIIFVDNVSNHMNHQNYRGAYFRLKGFKSGLPVWNEILLGSHSHENLEVLNKFSTIAYSTIANGRRAALTFDNKGDISLEYINPLPELPVEYQEKVNELKKYEGLDLPVGNDVVHLDASLDALKDHYDFLKDENIALGSCKELYRSLIRDNRYLCLDKDNFSISFIEDGKPEQINGKIWVRLNAELISYDTFNEDKDVIHPEYKNNVYLFNLELPVDVNSNLDDVFIFDKLRVLDDVNSFTSITEKRISIGINAILGKDIVSNKDVHSFTVLVAKNSKIDPSFRGRFLAALKSTDNPISLDLIQESLLKLYIKGKLDTKPKPDRLYLTANEYGEIVWENSYLPAQNFYVKQVEIADIIKHTSYETNKNEYDRITKIGGNEYLEIRFDNVFFNADPSARDFPLLMVDNSFDVARVPDVITECDLIYRFYLNDDRLSIYPDSIVTLIVIRSSTGVSVAEDLARNYVSKAEAVEILSRGKLNLEQYVQKTELYKYSKVGHTHNEYAKYDHNHDARYANYRHTHPELAALIVEIMDSDVDQEQIEKWIEDFVKKDKENFEAILSDIGINTTENGKYYVEDTNVRLSKEAIDIINNKIKDDELDEGQLLNEGHTVADAIDRLVLFFKHDTVTDEQVVLDDLIYIRNRLGGIPDDIKFYDKGTNLRKILTDILNPFKSATEIADKMTPANLELKWYIKSKDDENYFYPCDPGHILEYAAREGNESRLYFEILYPVNASGERCQFETIRNNKSVMQNTLVTVLEKTVEDFYNPFIKLAENKVSEYKNPTLDKIEELQNILDNMGLEEARNSNGLYNSINFNVELDEYETNKLNVVCHIKFTNGQESFIELFDDREIYSDGISSELYEEINSNGEIITHRLYHYPYLPTDDDIKNGFVITWTSDQSYVDLQNGEITDGVVYDNYGINHKILNPTGKVLPIQPKLEYGYPAVYIGTIKDAGDISYMVNSNFEEFINMEYMVSSFLDEPLKYVCNINLRNENSVDDKNDIFILVRYDIYEDGSLVISNPQTDNRIDGWFEIVRGNPTVNINSKDGADNYIILHYYVLSNAYDSLEIELRKLD